MYFQGKQKEAEQARLRFAGDTRSDHLALLNAFQVNVYRYIQTQVESFFCAFQNDLHFEGSNNTLVSLD